MSRYIVESLTDPRAKITAQTWGNVTDIVAPVKQFLQASALQQLTISPDVLIAMTGGGVFKTKTTILTVADLDTGSTFVFGRDYYVYCCDPGDGISDEVYKISLNSTYPAGYTAATSRKIGGFHYGQVRNSATIADVSIGIVPRSVWTTFWRPKCDPEGMVYLTGGIWADIYLSSDDGNGGLRSVYNATPITGTEGLNWYIALEKLRRSGKRMPSYAEFCMAAEGSPEGLDNSNDQAWSATNNSGRHATGTIAKATSLIGWQRLEVGGRAVPRSYRELVELERRPRRGLRRRLYPERYRAARAQLWRLLERRCTRWFPRCPCVLLPVVRQHGRGRLGRL
mgnify:CR=1 FL=1